MIDYIDVYFYGGFVGINEIKFRFEFVDIYKFL